MSAYAEVLDYKTHPAILTNTKIASNLNLIEARKNNLELYNYYTLNKIAQKNQTVLLGSSFAKAIPVCELKQSFDLNVTIYNRSITNLSVFDVKPFLNDCVFALAPKKLLLNLGETDLEQGTHSIPEIIEAYEQLITSIKTNMKHCTIVIVSVCNNDNEIHPEELNRQLEMLAKKTNCQYADISPAFSHDTPSIKAFNLLKFFLHDKITFIDAMTLVNI